MLVTLRQLHCDFAKTRVLTLTLSPPTHSHHPGTGDAALPPAPTRAPRRRHPRRRQEGYGHLLRAHLRWWRQAREGLGRCALFHLDMFFTVLLPPRVSHVLHPAARSRRRGFLLWRHQEVRDHQPEQGKPGDGMRHLRLSHRYRRVRCTRRCGG